MEEVLTRARGRVLALDYGDKRIGVAITDMDCTMVFPRPFLQNDGWDGVFIRLRDFCRVENVARIVIGCPYDDAHEENSQTEKVRKFGAGLTVLCDLPVDYEDEKYTTAEAEAMLSSADMNFREKKEARDSVAAMLILQSYLKRV